MSQYPQDEFDRIPEATARHGVHRERLAPVRGSGLGLKIAVGVLALLVGLAAYFLLPRLDPGRTEAAAAPVATQAGTPVEGAGGPAPEPTGFPAAAEPSGGSGGGSPRSPRAGSSADKAQVVNVLNSTGVPGLASTVAQRLAGDGWTETVPGNWAGAPLEGSVVFYNGEGQRTSAEAVASALDIAAVRNTQEVSPDLTVVLGPGFR